ncbi:divalent-cation tolerance protein CutA [Thalassotalea euphylliae]|uniref:divalent-cation tolerance protein CutA n=1 Tax=Thalassotalea euphylliae TaxID=1655234 RepID=UPI00363D7703
MYQIVLCTCPTIDVAESLAGSLVTAKLAACVNIQPGVTSIYQWQGKIEKAQEYLLMIKTKAEYFEQVSRSISEQHPYDVPEIVALDISQGNSDYLNWISDSLK